MRTLLRHTRTGLYFQGTDQWTNEPQMAYDFRFTDFARQYLRAWGMEDVEVAFAFEDPHALTMVSLDSAAVHFAAA
jgi:hypothetical protein